MSKSRRQIGVETDRPLRSTLIIEAMRGHRGRMTKKGKPWLWDLRYNTNFEPPISRKERNDLWIP